jgi:flagellar hook assembly protein FlgD
VVLGALSVESTPTEFALLQNFPNPFNPETTIKYNLAEASDVNLRIFNIVGQVVRTLVAERQSAGRYQVRWSGTDDRGASVSSGIYFYELSAGGKFQDVKRLMLLK